MNMMMTDFRTEMVITEILDTERSYVRHLREVVEDYLGYWKTRNVLSKVQCNQLFGNITEIYKFSKLFLCELESCKPNAREIARCFLNNRLKFIVYSTYCVNFHKSDSILSDLMRNPQTLNTILQRQKDLGHRLPLGSYLVFPIQRMLRYHLLLEKLAMYTPGNTSERLLVSKAHGKMTLLARIIDETKNKFEKGGRIKEMQQLMKQWQDRTNIELSNNCFELYAEGDLLIAGTKKKLRVILLNNVLLIAKEQKCGQLEYKDHISSNDMTITENVDGDPLSFCVSSNEDHKHSYKLQARVKKEKIFWVKTLNHMKADTTGFSAMTGLAELIAERFYLPSDLL
ncbi:pleckstrin homology domain-containing family G member 1-like isoform X1 [Adelges cooleyi]|uniref:pleckstrin homology domain-containing family G member 1-like isoform X1 n=1 Tax=Adelges cooleyi TaxID=133065 RepID=UPI00218061E5|nr:pleckstrin homology domain-containing family G member 1-like isoform X1 [Adelges cooleyi]